MTQNNSFLSQSVPSRLVASLILLFFVFGGVGCTKTKDGGSANSSAEEAKKETTSPPPFDLYQYPPNPNPNPLPRQFGYFASATEGVGTGDYTSEMPGQATFVFIDAWPPTSRLENVRAHNLKAVVSFGGQVFTDSTGRPRSNWKDRVKIFADTVRPYLDVIVALNTLDEPFAYGMVRNVPDAEMSQYLQESTEYIKSLLPGLPVATIFMSNDLKRDIPIPPALDWIGVDCYTGFENCEGLSIPESIHRLDMKLRKMDEADGKRRQIMVVPPSGFALGWSQGEASSLHQLEMYRKWLKYRTDIHIVMNFLWQSCCDGWSDSWAGTRDSIPLKEGYTRFYHDFMNETL